ncbi:MAG: hypothetical protein AAF483_06010 [Planctomycetota bacterium]
MRFTLYQFSIASTHLVVFFGTLLTSDVVGAVFLTLSVLAMTLLSVNALHSKNRLQTRYISGSLLAIYVSVWIATLFAASSSTSEYVESKMRTRNTSAVSLRMIDDDPYRTDYGRMMQHKSPWIYVGNSWSPFPFITSVEYGLLNEYDAGIGGRLYFLVSPISNQEIRSVFLWSRD